MATQSEPPSPDREDSFLLEITKSGPINLQVGERRFVTLPSTLTGESPYFARYLSSQWQQTRADGSYFVDADGDLFVYILRYLRSGVLPLFYSMAGGHDYGKYQALVGEAEYFGIERLKSWLKNRAYEDAVKVKHLVNEYDGLDSMDKTHESNVQLEYYPSWKIEKIYQSALGGNEPEYEEEDVLRTIVITKTLAGKLVSATNQPGRPSSGSDRKCTCPKSCACTGNCKCAKDGCLCVQQMFLVVALKSRPKPVWITQEPEKTPQWTDENGEQKTLNPVYTDLKGNILSPEEAKAREEERERRRNEPVKVQVGDEASSPIPSPGCRHKDTHTPTLQPQIAARECTLCPEHPNNTATRQYNAQQLNAMAANPSGTYIPTESMVNGQLFKPEVPEGSCMGGEASYFLTRGQPSLHDFHRLFPDYSSDDFVLTYPMDASTHTYTHMNNMAAAAAALPSLPDLNMPMDPLATMPPLGNPGFDMTFMNNEPLDFSFGDADVTTFGSALHSPPYLHSPVQPSQSCCSSQPPDVDVTTFGSALHSPSYLPSPVQPVLQSCCTSQPQEPDAAMTSPGGLADSQTINPDLLQGTSRYVAQVQPQPALCCGPAGSDSMGHDVDILFDNTLVPLPADPDIGMAGLLGSGFHSADQPFHHIVSPHPADPLHSPNF
ncbi:hypothetical protein DV735_g1905, partial [Chaetothyriales sp. CBS 134920]